MSTLKHGSASRDHESVISLLLNVQPQLQIYRMMSMHDLANNGMLAGKTAFSWIPKHRYTLRFFSQGRTLDVDSKFLAFTSCQALNYAAVENNPSCNTFCGWHFGDCRKKSEHGKEWHGLVCFI